MKKNRELAPVALFVYNRLENTRQTIECLKKYVCRRYSIIHIFRWR